MSVPAWRWCAVAGLATLILSVIFGRLPGLVSCGPQTGTNAMIALELVRSVADVNALFGSEPCTSRLITAQRQALLIDMLAFIPAYCIFLLSALAALWRNSLGLALCAFNMITFAAAFDVVEGLILFKLLNELPGDARAVTGLFWTARPKLGLIAVTEIAMALMLWRGSVVAKIAAGAMAAGGVTAFIYLLRAPHDAAMMRGHAVAWIALVMVALIGVWCPAMLGLRGPKASFTPAAD